MKSEKKWILVPISSKEMEKGFVRCRRMTFDWNVSCRFHHKHSLVPFVHYKWHSLLFIQSMQTFHNDVKLSFSMNSKDTIFVAFCCCPICFFLTKLSTEYNWEFSVYWRLFYLICFNLMGHQFVMNLIFTLFRHIVLSCVFCFIIDNNFYIVKCVFSKWIFGVKLIKGEEQKQINICKTIFLWII